jgi:hypothetical protein
MVEGRDAGLANQLAADISAQYLDRSGNFHEELNTILNSDQYDDVSAEVRRLAMAKLEADGLLPLMIVDMFGTNNAMNDFGHNRAIDAPFSDDWDNAAPLSNEAEWFGLEDFQELATGENEKPGEGDPDAAEQFLASAVVDRWDEIHGLAQDQIFDFVNDDIVENLGSIFEDSSDNGITLTDMRVWAGDPEGELADNQTQHAGDVANYRSDAENAIYFATDTNSTVPVLDRIAEGERVTRNEVGTIVNDRSAMSALPETQQRALQYLFDHWASITGGNETAMSQTALEQYAGFMGTSISQAQQNVRDLMALDASTVTQGSDGVNQVTMASADAAAVVTLTRDARLSSYIKTDSSNRAYIDRSDINALLDPASPVLTDDEKDLLRTVPISGEALFLDDVAHAAGYDSYSVLTGTRPLTADVLRNIRNYMSSEPALVTAMTANGFITREKLLEANNGQLVGFESLTDNQRRMISELLSSYDALSAGNPTQGVNAEAIQNGTVVAEATVAQALDPVTGQPAASSMVGDIRVFGQDYDTSTAGGFGLAAQTRADLLNGDSAEAVTPAQIQSAKVDLLLLGYEQNMPPTDTSAEAVAERAAIVAAINALRTGSGISERVTYSVNGVTKSISIYQMLRGHIRY